MDVRVLIAKHVNNGQSEIWCGDKPDKRRTVATNGILYPIRTNCSSEECAAIYKALDRGPAAILDAFTTKLATDFGL